MSKNTKKSTFYKKYFELYHQSMYSVNCKRWNLKSNLYEEQMTVSWPFTYHWKLVFKDIPIIPKFPSKIFKEGNVFLMVVVSTLCILPLFRIRTKWPSGSRTLFDHSLKITLDFFASFNIFLTRLRSFLLWKCVDLALFLVKRRLTLCHLVL